MNIGTLILNANSGSRAPRIIDALEARAREQGLDVAVIPDKESFGPMVGEVVARGEPLVIAAGGDGTVNGVLRQIAGTGSTLGVVPLGTVNHFARELGIPNDWETALDIALHGEVREIDTALINGRHFINAVHIGFYPEVFRAREAMRKRYTKWRAFAIALRIAYRRFPQVALVVETDSDMTTVHTPFFVVSVNAYDLEQHQLIVTKQELDAGRLTVYWLERRRRADFIRAIWLYLRGQVDRIEGLRRIHTRELRLQTSHETLRVAIDGELESLRSPIQIRIVPQSLRVKVPRVQ